MLNELLRQIRKENMLQPGDRVYCALSGGADSMALLWGFYLLRDKLGAELCAAHFNHGLRGEESDRDEAFVRDFCRGYGIPLTVGRGTVVAGKKGLEAAAREARYGFFRTLPGKIATAHTADDNAETVLLHLIRGTGLKGLGGIAPVNGNVIRPMLNITRQQVLSFLKEYHISWVEDSSNGTDDFLRNRIRHHIAPLLTLENPRFPENTSAMAQRLRQEEEVLSRLAEYEELPAASALRDLPQPVRGRMLERFLKENGVREPESDHIALAQRLVFSDNPSAVAHFPGGVMLRRSYDRLTAEAGEDPLEDQLLPEKGTRDLGAWTVYTGPADALLNDANRFSVCPVGPIRVRSRQPGDAIRLPGGTKTLKKIFIDRKIPARLRCRVPVFYDDAGILAVGGIGVNEERKAAELPARQIRLERKEK